MTVRLDDYMYHDQSLENNTQIILHYPHM